MKIYVENMKSDFIKTLKIMEKYKTCQQSKSEIYSDEGIYQINDKYLHKCIIEDDSIKTVTNYYKSCSILLDNSKIKYVEAYQIPYNHIILHIIEFHYLLSEFSKIKLVIKGNHMNKLDKLDEIENTYKHLTFYDLYFEVPDIDVNDKIVKKEITEFLSLLM